MRKHRFNSPLDFIRFIEKTQGELNIYENKLKQTASDSEIAEGIFNLYPDLMTRIYGSAEKAKRELLEKARNYDVVTNFYNPLELTLARKRAAAILGNRWREVSDILVAPVTIPSFNAAAVRSPEGYTVIIFNAQLTTSLPHFTALLMGAFKNAGEKNWEQLAISAIHIHKLIQAVRFATSLFNQVPDEVLAISDPVTFRTASDLWQIQMLFVLLHEYAHITCGHLSELHLEREHPLDNGLEFGKYYTQSQEEEFEADMSAASWLFSAETAAIVDDNMHINAADCCIVGTGVASLFATMAWFESYVNKSRDTHPPAFDRAERIFALADSFPLHKRIGEHGKAYLGWHQRFLNLYQSLPPRKK